MEAKTPRRIVGSNPRLPSYGLFGTVVTEANEPDNLLDVVWLDHPDDGADEIHRDNVATVSELTYQFEAGERRRDAEGD